MANSLDPSKTKTLRKKFMRDVTKRFNSLQKAIITLIVTDDAFGLEEVKPFKFNAQRQYSFLSSPAKVKQFRLWLQQNMDAGLLEVIGGSEDKPWLGTHIESAYRKGMARAHADVWKTAGYPETLDWYRGTQAQFVSDAFLQPETLSKVQLLYARAFEGMKDVAGSTSNQLSRILAEGLVNGSGPKTVAREIKKAIPKLKNRALTIARTEIIYAHAEGKLDSYELLGVRDVGVDVEFSTAGDGLVCPLCADLEGQVFKVKEAHGIIPVHPNCRCSFKSHL